MPNDDLLSTLAEKRPTETELSLTGRTRALELAREHAHDKHTDPDRTYTLRDVLAASIEGALWAAGYES